MKILIVSPYLPHPLSGHGTGVFMYRLLESLAQRHEIILISFCDSHELTLANELKSLPLEFYPVLREKGWQKPFFQNVPLVLTRLLQLFSSLVVWEPYYVSKYRHHRMAQLLKKSCEERRFDIVQFEFAYMGRYRKYVHSGKTVLHEHDVAYRPAYREYKKSRFFLIRVFKFLEWCRWALYERRIVRQFDHILTVTDQDRRLLEWLTRLKKISYLPRGVDVPDHIPEHETREPETLLFIGTFSHRPNLDAAMFLCKEIFPLVLQRFPRAILYIIGSNPTSSLQDLAKQHAGMKILGFVEDVEAYFQRSSVFIAPLRLGGGVKIKVLHAMAHGIPVVTTKIGAEGIEGIEPDSVLVANTPEKIAEHICSLLKDPLFAAAVGRKGWEVVRRRYSWDSVVLWAEHTYSEVLALGKKPSG